MNTDYFVTQSVTFAMKGKDILARHGFYSSVGRIPKINGSSCGYGIFIKGSTDIAEKLLKENGIPIVKTVRAGVER